MRAGAVAMAVLALAACTETPVTAPLSEEGVVERRASASLRPAADATVVDVALSVSEETGEFSTLIAAVVAADLVDDLSARGQRTVFAPTDAAFAELGLDAGNVGELPEDALVNILLYHVATGRLDAEAVVTKDRLRMLNGDFTEIDGATIDGANIVVTDVEASNGIIHVIDAVLLP
ncbi:MAG: fasciclin domain-containing protein [Gemmatimonadota bacterium]